MKESDTISVTQRSDSHTTPNDIEKWHYSNERKWHYPSETKKWHYPHWHKEVTLPQLNKKKN